MKIRELLSDETKWCKKALARDKNDEKIDVDSKHACKWCLYGAMCKCYNINEEFNDVREKIYNQLTKKRNMVTISQWNDCCSTYFKDVKELIDELDI